MDERYETFKNSETKNITSYNEYVEKEHKKNPSSSLEKMPYILVVIDELAVDEIKTAKIVALLKGLDVNSKALIVTADADEKVYKSARNIKGVDTTYVGAINTYEVLSHTKCIILKDAVTKLEEVYA